jgi:IS30 family transposase
MTYHRRMFLTDQQKAEIWDRRHRGCSMNSIGRRFERNSSTIYPLLARTVGIRPPDRTRSRLALTLGEREEIFRSLQARQSLRSIARSLQRSASTISREVGRIGGAAQYRATPSDQAAWHRTQRAPNPASWLAAHIFAASYSPNSRGNGPCSRLQAGLCESIPLMRRCA